MLILFIGVTGLSHKVTPAKAEGSGAITLTVDGTTEGDPIAVKKGEMFTVVCRVSAATGVLESDFYVDYNSAVISFVEGGPKVKKETGGVHVQSLDNTDSPVRRTFSMKFLAKEEGDCDVFIRNGARVTDGDGDPLSLQTAHITLHSVDTPTDESLPASMPPDVVATPDPSQPSASPEPTEVPKALSGNCRVRSLLTNAIRMAPAFDPGISNYEAEVKSDTMVFFVDYVLAGRNATAKLTGNRDLTYGVNKVTLTVTAENGKKKKYTFLVTRLTQPEKSDAGTPAASGNAAGGNTGLDKEEKGGYSIVLYVVIALLAVFSVSMIILVKKQQRELQYYYEEEEKEEREESRETEDDRGSGEGDLEGSEVRGEDGEFGNWY